MSFRKEYRSALINYRKTGAIPVEHSEWLQDHDYAAAFRAVTKEMQRPPKPRKPAAVKVKSRRGRPKKIAAPEPEATESACQAALDWLGKTPPNPPQQSPGEVTRREPEPEPAEAASTTSPVREQVIPSKHGYTKLYLREGQELEPVEPEAPPKPPPDPDFVASVEVTVTSDADQKKIIDEYGELDRRMQLRAMDYQRYETLKRAIKSWFDGAPADADGTVEGDVYLLHLSARERERRVRSMRELHDLLGLDKFLELVSVSIGQLENLLGKAHVASLCADARTGSRRIKAIAKKAVVVQ